MNGFARLIKAVVVSGAAVACGVWLQGCSSSATASEPDTGAADVGHPEGSDGATDADGSGGDSAGDVVVRVTFDLPSKSYRFDAQAWMVPAGNSVAVPCGSGATTADCCNPPAPAAPSDCAATPLVCEASLCTVKVRVTVAQEMDLVSEVPVLSGLTQTMLGDVSLQQLRFAATSTLNVSLPSLQLYLAPGGTSDPTAAGAQALGTISAIPAGFSTSGDVVRSSASDALFATYARALGTPFTFIISGTVSVPSGSPQPTGTLTLTIAGQVSATL